MEAKKINYNVFQDNSAMNFESVYEEMNEYLSEIGAVFVYKHRNYIFPGDSINGDVVEYLLYNLSEFTDRQVEILDNKFNGIYNDECLEYLIERIFGKLKHTVYIYDHSGISISTGSFGCMWDSGVLGVIGIVDKDKYRQNIGTKRINVDKALERLDNWVTTMNDYVTGNCWGFQVTDEEGDVIDYCGGFVGDFDTVLDDMASTVDSGESFETIKAQLVESYDNL